MKGGTSLYPPFGIMSLQLTAMNHRVLKTLLSELLNKDKQ